MKKKIFACLIVGLVVSLSSTWARSSSGKRYSKDGYFGNALAVYYGEWSETEFNSFNASAESMKMLKNLLLAAAAVNDPTYRPYQQAISVEKLTKEELFLIESSLEEYFFRSGEVYAVCLESDRFINVFVRINSVDSDGSYNYSWKGAATILGYHP